MIFLSDGECGISDQTVQDLCRNAITLGYSGYIFIMILLLINLAQQTTVASYRLVWYW